MQQITVYVLVSFYDGNGLHKQGTICKINSEDFNPLYMKKIDVPSGNSSLEDLSDVVISSVDDGEALIYDETTGKWVNGIAGGGTIIDDIQLDDSGNVESLEIDGSEYTFATGKGDSTIDYVQLNSDDLVELMTIDGDNYYFAEGQSTIDNIQHNDESKVSSFDINGSTEEFTSIDNIVTSQSASGEVVESLFINGDHYDFGIGESTLENSLSTQSGFVYSMSFDGDTYSFVKDLGDLDNVDVIGASDGDLLSYDSTNDQWVATTHELDDISDVDVTGATDGQVLTYDATNQEWVPTTPSGGGGALVVTLSVYVQGTQVDLTSLSSGQSFTVNADKTYAQMKAADDVIFKFTDTTSQGSIWTLKPTSCSTLNVSSDMALIYGISILANGAVKNLKLEIGAWGAPYTLSCL